MGVIAQSDAIEDEVVRVAHDENAGAVLLHVVDLGEVSEVPPGVLHSKERFAAAAVDGAVAHDRAPWRMVCEDKGFASMAAPIDDPAAAGGHVVVPWIARGVDDGVCVDEQGDGGLKMERGGKKTFRSPEPWSSTASPLPQ